jgi:hypothetical protein
LPIQEIIDVSTEEFWARYAKKGAIGLVGGTLWIHRASYEAQALVTPDEKPSLWAHAFIFTGKRPDGYDWLAESDLVVEPLRLRGTIGENFTPAETVRGLCAARLRANPGFRQGESHHLLDKSYP